jgi:DNA-binding LacI/PurR family transcriptional regulator
LRVPEDISVVGFDDVPSAAFNSPGLTTVRQPLQRMGQIAAKTVIDQVEGNAEYVPEILIAPEFVVRASTGPAAMAPMMLARAGSSAVLTRGNGEVASTD